MFGGSCTDVADDMGALLEENAALRHRSDTTRRADLHAVVEALDTLDARAAEAQLTWSHDTDPSTARSAPRPVTNTDRANAVLEALQDRSEAATRALAADRPARGRGDTLADDPSATDPTTAHTGQPLEAATALEALRRICAQRQLG